MSSVSTAPRAPVVSPHRVRWQIALLTVAAIALYVGVRQLPTGTNLSHLDFRVSGGNSIEFCDPANPQFIPVVAVQSPVSMGLKVDGPAPVCDQPAHVVVALSTSTGKPIAPVDLLVSHTEMLHLLVFDPELRDYQHVHPQAGQKPGEWLFTFTPHRSGNYRIFADFTPAATARGLYASADLDVAGGGDTSSQTSSDSAEAATALEYRDGDLIFELKPASLPLKARAVSDFQFAVRKRDGTAARLEPVMDAYAHLVAVDRARSGFAHLHPAQLIDPKATPGTYSQLNFKVTIPSAGRYVIWAQVRVDGRDCYAPFWFNVVNA